MTQFLVTFEDNSEITIQATDRFVAVAAAKTTNSKRVFSVTLVGCTGLSEFAHFGRHCPIHSNA